MVEPPELRARREEAALRALLDRPPRWPLVLGLLVTAGLLALAGWLVPRLLG